MGNDDDEYANTPTDWDHEALFDRERRGAKIAERLKTLGPHLVPLTKDAADLARMIDWDLSSCVTYRFGLDIDPDEMQDPEVRDHWMGCALDDGEYFGNYFDLGRRPYWIIADGERIGTTGYWVRENGHDTTLELLSVYIRPRHRRQGWASRILRRITDVAFEVGVGRVLVSCDWGNQAALRFYLAQGMWVQSWKRDIRFVIDRSAASLRLQVEGTRATFLVGDRIVGIADNRGDRLGWQLGDGIDKDLKWLLEATASVYLALMIWPIVRDDEAWQRQLHWGITDCGDFENLALRIRRFERHLRHRGWKTPLRNPSFATLPKLIGVQPGRVHLEVTVSDGLVYHLPFALLDPAPSDTDPVQCAVIADDEVVVTLDSGAVSRTSVDHLLWANQTPEHLHACVSATRSAK